MVKPRTNNIKGTMNLIPRARFECLENIYTQTHLHDLDMDDLGEFSSCNKKSNIELPQIVFAPKSFRKSFVFSL